MAKIVNTIEAIGTIAQPGPRRRSNSLSRGGSRGAATTAACSASRPASEGMNGNAMPRAYVQAKCAYPPTLRRGLGPELVLQRPQLVAQRLRQLLAELGVVLVHLR